MKRTSIPIHTFTVLCTILLTGIEFLLFYFLDLPLAVFLATISGAFLLAHAGLEFSCSYDQGTLQVGISTLISALLIILLYFYRSSPLVHYHHYVLLILLLNWLVPTFYLCIRNMLDAGPRFVGFRSFFRKVSIFFTVYYAWFFAIAILSKKMYLYSLVVDIQPNYIPFYHLISHISSFSLGQEKLEPIICYALIYLFAFLPAGILFSILMRKKRRMVSVLSALALSIAAELIRILLKHPFQVDHIIFGFLGALLGIALYQLWNNIYLHYTGVNFMDERKSHSFYTNVYYKL
ncbi:MAG: VanZ family protein [Clostridiales bacterium]|nr:VanZ family protein [Clostridiales bacterium]